LHYPVITLAEADSTNDYAIAIASNIKPQEGTIVITENQTRGRGLENNYWESEPGKNLTFSVILYPSLPPDKQFDFNKAIALAVYSVVSSYLPTENVSIKWPNDIYVGDRKICGILIQNSVTGNRFDYVIAGIGLNVNQLIFKSNAPNPVSLSMLTGLNYNLNNLLEEISDTLMDNYYSIGNLYAKSLLREYDSALYRLNQWHNYILENEMLTARIIGTTHYGQLQLELKNGKMVYCDLKQVKYIL
jgi:BirA family biotin operon repressor/biotin-[acetyl-CoA-carboxylase] ligase